MPEGHAPKNVFQKLIGQRYYWLFLAAGGFFAIALAAGLAVVAVLNVTDKKGEEVPVAYEAPTPVVAVEPTSPPFVLGPEPDQDTVGDLLIPLPPVFEIPGNSPQLLGIDVENRLVAYDNILNVHGYYANGTVWHYSDSNEPSYSAHWRRLDILFALLKSGWRDWPGVEGDLCHEYNRIYEADENGVVKAVLEIECERPDGEEIRWDVSFNFKEYLSDLLAPDQIPSWQSMHWQLCTPEGCLTGVDLAKAYSVGYEIKSSTADFYEGAPIPPVLLPVGRIRFTDYSAYGALYTDGDRGPRWIFTDLGGWSDEESWATIRYLMQESGFSERCEEDAKEVGGVFVSAYACYNQNGEQLLWSVNESDRVWHELSTRGLLERSEFVLLPTLTEALNDLAPLYCRVGSISSDPESMFRSISELLELAGMDPSNLIESYDDLLASGVEVVLKPFNPNVQKCALVVSVEHSQDYGSIIYEREDGGVRHAFFRIPFDDQVGPREGWPKDLLEDWVDNSNPWWYVSTPIQTEQYVAVYDSDTFRFEIHLTGIAGGSEEEIRTATGQALWQLADLGISLDRQDYYVLAGSDH